MQCDRCGSDNTQRLEMAFQSGTKEINTTSVTGGVITGRLGLGGAVTNTQGTSQSMLAQNVAPPAKQSFKPAIILIFVAIVFFAMNSYIGWAVLAIGLFAGYGNYRYNTQRWPGLYNAWLDKWICLKCGNIYTHAQRAMTAKATF